jgi:hypothetical protein
LRRKSKYCYTPNIIALGDFNLPKREDSDPVYKALRATGLELPNHSTKIYSNISNDAEYDQIAFFPRLKDKLTGKSGVFDFDGGIFPDIYANFDRSTELRRNSKAISDIIFQTITRCGLNYICLKNRIYLIIPMMLVRTVLNL